MKISLNWVKQFTDIKLPVDELVEKIGAQLGAVEEVINLGKKHQGITIAKVATCVKHPDADRLSVCMIDDGGAVKDVPRNEKGLVQVVCGAPNVRAEMLVAWLPPGTTVPATLDKDPLVLEAREIRGVVSNGMLASASELAISDDHHGILEIDNPGAVTHKDLTANMNDHAAALENIRIEPRYKPGDDFAEAFGLDDYIIDIENKMFTHRPDCFGILGVAREIAGITGQKFSSPKIYKTEKTKPTSDKKSLQLKVENKAGDLVPRFMAQIFEDLKVGASPVWMQTYLMRVGVRPINNIVDITNYFMVLTGQPMHAYDYDKLPAKSLETRASKKGDKLKLLNGKELLLTDDSTILITSGDVPVGVGGVMGGAGTEVDASTRNIVLECANFNMYSIRRTSMKYGLFTDAVTRFNKGQSPLQCGPVLAWASNELICHAAAQPGNMIDLLTDMKEPKMIRVSSGFINERLGLKLTGDDMEDLLINVEFDIERSDNKDELKVTPPFWRTDIEIPEDIVEEIGRLYGYDHLPIELPARSIKPVQRNPVLELKSRIRDTLSRGGANEVLTYSFVHGDLLAKVGQDKLKAYELSNAISPDLQYYRLSLTPSLLDKVHMNIKAGFDQFAIFEINKIHMKGIMDPSDDGVPLENTHLALVFAADQKIATGSYDGSAYYQAKKYLETLLPDATVALLQGFDFGSDAWGEQLCKPYEPRRSAVIVKDGMARGVLGEFRSAVKRALKLPEFTAGLEISIDLLSDAKPSSYVTLPRFPKVSQDITLRISADISQGELYAFAQEELNKLKPQNTLATLNQIDIYQRQENPGSKQITLRLSIASYDRTLTDQEVNTLLDEIAGGASEKFGSERI